MPLSGNFAEANFPFEDRYVTLSVNVGSKHSVDHQQGRGTGLIAKHLKRILNFLRKGFNLLINPLFILLELLFEFYVLASHIQTR